ncbi:MAG: bifunctional phosphoribosyl-AMP cyclohydrolase/phosphoribosyl-ATP diphosphatase HisIE [Lachnospiraceae bacterium]|nr:bifunctional phosphoribosyl-AMP cyclohydrolase/phosphoribosyl-ATP diphosphatase HisIE [Lachnospiraceae bacterium]
MKKLIIPEIYLKNGLSDGEDPVKLAKHFSESGADAIILYDLSSEDEEHDVNLHVMKEIYRAVEVPLYGGGNIKRVEDVKKILYTGCAKAILNFSKESNREMLEEVSKRFGKEKIAASVDCQEQLLANNSTLEEYASMVVAVRDLPDNTYYKYSLPIIAATAKEVHDIYYILEKNAVMGVTGSVVSQKTTDFMNLKNRGNQMGIETNILRSEISWDELKLNSDGMVPVIVQDYRTNEVLMLAYMTEEAFKKTLETGLMTYYSRSRNCLWTKGLTSGHVQYVKSLTADCDYDTILAKVSQVGVACHTGKPSCFFNSMMRKDYKESNPLKVFENVYDTIMDRKENPKEGSYTNYLFDKGIDKILKKVGEEATEIIIAAKNPEPEEIKYEMADFLYHAMVLMAEKGITWDEIIEELDNRH